MNTWLFDNSSRGKLRFQGPQAAWFLGQLLTNDVGSLRSGQGMQALLLRPNGKIVAPMRVVGAGAELLLDTEPDKQSDLLGFFSSRIFTTQVEIEDCTQSYALVSVLGEKAAAVVKDALQRMTLPEEEHGAEQFGAGWLVRVIHPIGGIDIWVRRDHKQDLMARLEAAGAVTGDDRTRRDIEVASGTPQFGVDYDESFLPQEAAMEKAVHFEKGCYLGQEAVAMAQRGRLRRRLRRIVFEEGLATGDVVFEDQPAGTVTSAVSHEGKGFGIGVVSTAVPIGATVTVGGTAGAVIEELPGTHTGPERPSARRLREQLQGQAEVR